MKYEEIQEMLDRYWEGETTLEEERKIKAYFNTGSIDERLRSVSPMFQAIHEEQTVQLAAKTKVVPMRPRLYQWAVAASLALMLFAGWCMFRDKNIIAPIATQSPNELPQAIETPAIETPQKSLVLAETTIPKKSAQTKKRQPKSDKPTSVIDPETAQAMAEIKAALALVSSKLDKGRTEAIKGATHLEAMDKVPKRKEG